MFYFPIYNFLTPNIFDSTTNAGKQINVPHQLAFHFLKKDEITGETREADINDDIHIIKGDQSGALKWQYMNLKDVLYHRWSDPCSTINTWTNGGDQKWCTYFSRKKDTMFAANTSHYSYSYKYVSQHFVALTHNGNDYIVPAKRVNWNDLSLYNIWAIGTEKDLLYTRVKALCDKHGITTIPNCQAIYKLTEDMYIIGEWAGGYYMNTPAFLVDGKTPFKDSFFADYTAMWNKLNEYGLSNSGTNGKVSNVVAGIAIDNEEYYPLDKTKIWGTDTSGKIKLWDATYLDSRDTRSHIYEPVHTLGLIVWGDGWMNPGGRSGNKILFVSNLSYNLDIHKLSGNSGASFIVLNNNREFKTRWDHRIQSGYYNGLSNARGYLSVFSIDEQNRFSAVIDMYMNYNVLYPSGHLKNAEIYRTPKNKDFDYFTITKEDVKSIMYDIAPTGRAGDGSGMISDLTIWQKGYTGKSITTNYEEYIALGNSKATDIYDNMTHHGFVDMNIIRNSVMGFASPTDTSNYVGLQSSPTYEVDNVLVDGAFDHFNEIFYEAPIYIVDTNILKTYGLDGDKYHKYMPSRCIWFEVNDLYTYTADGKIDSFNTKYVDANYKFIYDLQQFTKFKAKYTETAKEVLWDTKKADNTDFLYMDSMYIYTQNTGEITLTKCSTVYDYFSIIWYPLSQAIFRLYGIVLNTALTPEQAQQEVINA